jgi:hypothetical protein
MAVVKHQSMWQQDSENRQGTIDRRAVCQHHARTSAKQLLHFRAALCERKHRHASKIFPPKCLENLHRLRAVMSRAAMAAAPLLPSPLHTLAAVDNWDQKESVRLDGTREGELGTEM